MKTAMQLMLEDLELRYKVLSDAQMLQACAAIEGTIEYAKSLTIKEKEQIIDAYYGKINGVFGYREEGQEYYNQTFNQNK
jgi:hypothetical protein